jgi:hypothetical protein
LFRAIREKSLTGQRSPAAAVISLFGARIQAASPAFAVVKQPTERRRFPHRSIRHNPRCKPRQPIDRGELRDFMHSSRGNAGGASRFDGVRHIRLTVVGKTWREQQTLGCKHLAALHFAHAKTPSLKSHEPNY